MSEYEYHNLFHLVNCEVRIDVDGREWTGVVEGFDYDQGMLWFEDGEQFNVGADGVSVRAEILKRLAVWRADGWVEV